MASGETALSRQLVGMTRRDWADDADGTVRFALVGLGWWTREWVLPAIEQLPSCEATVAVSGTPDKREAVAAEWGMEAVSYEAYADGAATDAYDAAYVCTPNATHLDQVRPAARHDKAVLCEKPMEATPERAAEMVNVCEQADVPLMIGYRMQTDPVIRRLRTLIRDGLIGEPIHAHGHMSQPGTEYFDTDSWRFDPAMAGGGASVSDLGIYPLNTTRFLLDTDPESVRATARSEDAAFADVPDEHASFEVTFENGTVGQFSTSQNAQLAAGLELIGTDGAVRVAPAFFDRDPARVELRRGDETEAVSYQPVDGTTEEFAYFANRLSNDKPLEPTGAHGLTDVRTIHAAYEAAERDERVSVPSDDA